MPIRLLCRAIRVAARDDKVSALLMRTGPNRGAMTMGQMQELRAAIGEFRARGKVAIAWSETFGEFGQSLAQYYISSICDRVIVSPSGSLCMVDMVANGMFLREALDKYGVEPQLRGRKEYKNARKQLMNSDFDEEHRESMVSLLNSVRAQMLREVASDRRLDEARVEELIQSGPHTSGGDRDKLKATGLVDDVLYRDEIYDQLGALVRQARDERERHDNDVDCEEEEEEQKKEADDVNLLFLSAYLKKRGSPLQKPVHAASLATGVKLAKPRSKHRVALIRCVGVIHLGRSTTNMFGDASDCGSVTISRAIRAAVADQSVKAIILQVDSPGGSYVGSDAIAREVQRARAKGKVVVSSMLNVAASGGYFVSMHCNKIVANPATLTGSIGVLAGKLVTKAFWKNLGINWATIPAGPNAEYFSTQVQYDSKGYGKLDEFLDIAYEDFTAQVARGRGMTREAVEEVARGRVWTGEQALTNGLVDRLGGLDTAIDVVRQLLDLPAETGIDVVAFPKQPSLLESLSAKPVENSIQRDQRGTASSAVSDGWHKMVATIGALQSPMQSLANHISASCALAPTQHGAVAALMSEHGVPTMLCPVATMTSVQLT
eukprot:TRINITY_DN65798_c8_g13_i1.p1 TRINITY_DN65798_c8_g13~~TRINITY_DN65798_c8_g13_i1.p1  ORF type:complete len:654 (-),score=360.39 TRINITY_DN65798_c8_g13_i1:874-2688(-)